MLVLIVGGGKVGTYLASMLLEQGHQVRVFENRPDEITRLEADLPKESIVFGNGTDPIVLEANGARKANVLAAVTGLDENNLVAAWIARSAFGVARTIARINNPKNAWIFTPEMGVDVALNEADLVGHLIAEEMNPGDLVTLLKLRRGLYSVVEEVVHPGSEVVGKTVADICFPDQCVLAAVIRRGDVFIPHGNVILEPYDEVLAVVHESQVISFAQLLGSK
jgi:trk system potassium uptake protein TrkA